MHWAGTVLLQRDMRLIWLVVDPHCSALHSIVSFFDFVLFCMFDPAEQLKIKKSIRSWGFLHIYKLQV